MIKCPSCHSVPSIRSIYCGKCDLEIKGDFMIPRLARLSPRFQKLAEQFLLCGGNLKIMAETLDISYPTLRKNIDEMIEAIETSKKEDDKKIETILTKIENGEMSSEKGLRLIKEMNGEL